MDARDDDTIQSAYAWAAGSVIGVYFNPPGVSPEQIVVADNCIVVCSGLDRVRVNFNEIAVIDSPEKGAGGRIHLKLKNGKRVDLVVGGAHGNFEDVFEFVRFLRRVTEAGSSQV